MNIILTTLFIVVCLAWATTSLSIKIAVETIPPFMSSGLRFVMSSLMFLVLALMRSEPILFPKRLLPFFVCVTIFYFTIPYWLINFSAQYVSSGLVALLFSTMPVFGFDTFISDFKRTCVFFTSHRDSYWFFKFNDGH